MGILMIESGYINPEIPMVPPEGDALGKRLEGLPDDDLLAIQNKITEILSARNQPVGFDKDAADPTVVANAEVALLQPDMTETGESELQKFRRMYDVISRKAREQATIDVVVIDAIKKETGVDESVWVSFAAYLGRGWVTKPDLAVRVIFAGVRDNSIVFPVSAEQSFEPGAGGDDNSHSSNPSSKPIPEGVQAPTFALAETALNPEEVRGFAEVFLQQTASETNQLLRSGLELDINHPETSIFSLFSNKLKVFLIEKKIINDDPQTDLTVEELAKRSEYLSVFISSALTLLYDQLNVDSDSRTISDQLLKQLDTQRCITDPEYFVEKVSQILPTELTGQYILGKEMEPHNIDAVIEQIKMHLQSLYASKEVDNTARDKSVLLLTPISNAFWDAINTKYSLNLFKLDSPLTKVRTLLRRGLSSFIDDLVEEANKRDVSAKPPLIEESPSSTLNVIESSPAYDALHPEVMESMGVKIEKHDGEYVFAGMKAEEVGVGSEGVVFSLAQNGKTAAVAKFYFKDQGSRPFTNERDLGNIPGSTTPISAVELPGGSNFSIPAASKHPTLDLSRTVIKPYMPEDDGNFLREALADGENWQDEIASEGRIGKIDQIVPIYFKFIEASKGKIIPHDINKGGVVRIHEGAPLLVDIGVVNTLEKGNLSKFNELFWSQLRQRLLTMYSLRRVDTSNYSTIQADVLYRANKKGNLTKLKASLGWKIVESTYPTRQLLTEINPSFSPETLDHIFGAQL